ncbi:unnamed protein product [Gordionus sp. m RMFG-2023]
MIFKFLILLLFVGHVASYTYKYVNDPKLFEVVNANWKVAIDMYKQLLKKNPGDGFLFSPYSMIVDLLGLHEGANGHTANAIRCKLGLANITSHYKVKLLIIYIEVMNQKNYELLSSKFFYFDDSIRLLTKYTSDTAMFFLDAVNIEFSDTVAATSKINQKVSEDTNGKMSHHIPDGLLTSDTKFLISSALDFKCKWEVQFDSVIQGQFKTVDGAFKPQTYMEKTGVFKIGYIPNLSLRILELPYFNNTLASYIFLPNCSVGLTAFETSRLDTKTLIDLIAALKPMNARISIPRFEASSHHQLSSDFEAIGLGNLFTPGEADFSRIYSNAVADKLALNYYVQQASVSFDIEGANSPSQETPVNPETTEEFKADHSFLYVIIGKRRNVPFFIGRSK